MSPVLAKGGLTHPRGTWHQGSHQMKKKYSSTELENMRSPV